MTERRRRPVAAVCGAALVAVLQGCSRDRTDPAALFLLQARALEDLEQGRLVDAEANFRKVIAAAPDDPAGYANLGITYLRGGRFEEAERQLRRAQRRDPASIDIGLSLARLQVSSGRADDARALLDRLLERHPNNAQVLYAQAELDAAEPDVAGRNRYENRLRRILETQPGNLAVRIKLLNALATRGAADSVIRQLEEVRRLAAEPPVEASAMLDSTIQNLRASRMQQGRMSLDRFTHLMELTAAYQASLDQVKWLEGPLTGRTVLTFAPQSLIGLRAAGADAPSLPRFTDATVDAGLPEPTPPSPTRDDAAAAAMALAVGDYDDDDEIDVFVSYADSTGAGTHMYHARGGQFLDLLERTGIAPAGGASFATFADYDNDGRLDLFVIDRAGRGHLFRNREGGAFEDVAAEAGLAQPGAARSAVFVDADHDGDLDLLLLGGARLRVQRNNLDGTFTDVASSMGLAGAVRPRAAAIGDFDDDGRIDLFVVADSGGSVLYRNTGGGRFEDVTAARGLALVGPAGAVAAGDYDNDGMLDLLTAPLRGGSPLLWRNRGDGTFARDDRSAAALQQARSLAAAAVEFVDYDNDGWLDVVLAGTPVTREGAATGVLLLHNDGTGRFREHPGVLPARVPAASALAVTDVDADGDQDLLVGVPRGLRLLRNDGGNANLSARIRLIALRTGSGKNNTNGIGARIELRAGELYQTRVVTAGVTHFGLGPHLKADVLRVQWPNGVPQTIFFPGTDQDVLELEQLKGSCAFLYTWDGTRFRFVTDVMWRSALGMPLGIMGGGATAWAPAGASQEYLRIPGDALRPRDGGYVLQFTEELWETAYLDEIRLLAVDHPDSVDVFVDERFVPPGPVGLKLFRAVRRRPPLTATNERGDDVRAELLRQDSSYVSNLTPLRYQGLVEPHDLVLDLGADAGAPGTQLFLRGWIYPTDASINVALAQQDSLKVELPRLDVIGANGNWMTAIPSLGFPSGKDKTIVINLAGLFPTADRRVRIRTNMQIYWDQAFVAFDAADAAVTVTTLPPATADLHYRGFSRMYRRGGRYGPHWFVYDDVTRTSPWRTIEGNFTRFGDVLPLLRSADDMFVVMGPGDETTVTFAAPAGTPGPGWTRTFLLYTDGWIKDADLNTAFGNTVEPLPFHAATSYPYGPGEAYPDDAAHRRYLQEYHTRTVRRR